MSKEDKANDPALGKLLVSCPDWMWAVQDTLTYWMGQSLCFSSGEIVAALAVHRPDLNLDVVEVGHFLHFLFGIGSLASYEAHTRVTTGHFKCPPAGLDVWVYGPSKEAVQAHDFEIPLGRRLL